MPRALRLGACKLAEDTERLAMGAVTRTNHNSPFLWWHNRMRSWRQMRQLRQFFSCPRFFLGQLQKKKGNGLLVCKVHASVMRLTLPHLWQNLWSAAAGRRFIEGQLAGPGKCSIACEQARKPKAGASSRTPKRPAEHGNEPVTHYTRSLHVRD